jgi:hypothetical protein
MPSPYGQSRSAASYYQYGGVPRHYVYNWEGGPPPASRAAETRALGTLGALGALGSLGTHRLGDSIDIAATAVYHKDLSGYPVAMSMASGQSSLLHSGPEQSHVHKAPPHKAPSMGAFGLSQNETRLAMAAALGVVGYIGWKALKRRKRRR